LDPAAVPVYPVLRLVLREVDDGGFEGLVDDAVIATGDELEPVRAKVIAEAARRAADRPGRAIRARGTGPDGSVFELVVPAEGDPIDAAEAVAARSQKKLSPKALIATGAAAGAVVAVIILALVLIISAAGSRPASRPVAATSSQPVPTPTQLPIAGPNGWASEAAWSVRSGAQSGSSAAAVAADATHVFALPDSSSVAGYAASSGVQRWRQQVRESIQQGPALTTVDGHPAVVASTADMLYAWAPATGDPLGSWKLPVTGARVQVTATGPVVSGQGQHAFVVVDGRLEARVLPASSTAVAPGPDGSLLVAGAPGQVWAVGSASIAGSPMALSAPSGYTFSNVVGSTSTQLVAAFTPSSTSSSQQVVLRGFRIGSWQALWTSSKLPAVQTASSSSAPLQAAPSGEWGIYGSTVLNLKSGATKALPTDWVTSVVADKVGFGTSAGHVLSVTDEGLTQAATAAPAASGQTVSAPVAPQAVSGTAAVVLAPDGQSNNVYLVRIDNPAATAAPAPTPSSTAKASPTSKPKPKPSSKPARSTKSTPPKKGASR